MWNEAPDFEEVQRTFLELGQKRAELRKLKASVQLAAIPIKKENPRKPYLVEEATIPLQEKIGILEAEIEVLEARRDFLNFHKELYKQYGYNNR